LLFNSGCSDLIYPTFKVGDIGPGGGYVFYDKGNNRGGWRYLEAAPANIPNTSAWASAGFTTTDITGTGTAIGSGRQNTILILAVDANAPAALACRNYSNNGYNDWFLPSRDELNELYKQRALVGISSGMFWSSSQSNNVDAWLQYFSSGSQADGTKSDGTIVRAVRAF